MAAIPFYPVCTSELCLRHAFVARRRSSPARTNLPEQARDGNLEAHSRPAARRALYREFSTELASPVPHRLLAHPNPGSVCVEAAPVVGHLYASKVAVAPEPHQDTTGPRVAAGVGERLLDDAYDLPTGPLAKVP